MNRLNYKPPSIEIEELKVDADFALGCGTAVPATTVSCLRKHAYDDYEALTEIWGISPDAPLSGAAVTGIVFSSDVSCRASCYQGPYDSFFAS